MLSKLMRLGGMSKRGFSALLIVSLVGSQLAFMVPAQALDSTLSGTITGDGTPIEDAAIDVLDQTTATVVGSDTSDAAGDYSVIVTAGTYNVRVTPPATSGFETTTVNNVNLSSSQVLNVALLIQDGNRIYAGVLKDSAGSPLAGATMQLHGSNGTFQANTSAAGEFTIGAPSGQYGLSINHGPTGVQLSSIGTPIDLATNMSGQNLVLNNHLTWTITVTNPEGAPVSGFGRVTQTATAAAPVHLAPGLSFTGTIITEGVANPGEPLVVSMVPGVPASLWFDPSPPDLTTFTEALPAISTNTASTFVAARGNNVYTGTLKDQTGAPVIGATMQLHGSSGTFQTNTSAGGEFTISAPSGTYGLTIDGQLNGDIDLTTVGSPINLATSLTGQNLVITRALTWTVGVVDPEGTEVSGAARVTQTFDAAEPISLLPGLTFTGSFRLEDVVNPGAPLAVPVAPGGTLGLWFDPSPLDLATFEVAGIMGIMTDTSVVFTAPRTLLTYRGSVKDHAGNPATGTIQLRGTNGTFQANLSASGDFVVSAPSGSYDLVIDGQLDGDIDFTTNGAPLQLTASMSGQHLVIDRSIDWTTTVLDPGGQEVSGGVKITQTISSSSPLQLLPGLPFTGSIALEGSSNAGDPHVARLAPGGTVRFVFDPSPVDLSPIDTTVPGFTVDTSTVFQTQRPLPPAAPQNLSAPSPTKAFPVLTWSPASGAASYKLFRGGVEIGTTNTVTFTDSTVAADGSYTYTVQACNSFGCSSASNQATVVYDTTAPMVGYSLSTPPNANGWHNANVTIDWQATDSGSGSPTDPANTVATTEAANVTYTSGQSCDLAGNCATGSVQLSIDKTAPTQSNFTPTTPMLVVVGSRNFTIDVTDGLSGVQRTEYYFDTDPGQGSGTAATLTTGTTYGGVLDTGAGNFLTPHTVFVRTQDRAGNWSTTFSRSYTELF